MKFAAHKCLLLLVFLSSIAGHAFSAALEIKARSLENSQVTIPLVQAGKLLLIEAEVDGLRGNFILDTGAPYLVLNTTYFRNTIKIDTLVAGGITGAPCDLCRTRIGRLNLSSIHYDSLEADVIPLGQIENKRGVKILGLFGLELFKGFQVEIDLRQQVLRINLKALEHPKASLTWPMELKNSTLIFEGEIAGKKLTWVLDSGAETVVLGSHLKKKVLNEFQIKRQVLLTGSTGEGTEVFFGILPRLSIADYPFEALPAILGNLDTMGKAYGFEIDGMIGYDLFLRGRVMIDFVNQEIHMYLYE
ncbi:MAG: retropepsin-like domain-containing protein [Flavobacteriales bacterium]|nr:retropepsin-like domain-containing protein [Flavobacteriales bacterium]